jgi:DNA-binding transcriptional regulator YdaS (Cro superfamily)
MLAKVGGEKILTTAEAAKLLGVRPVRVRQFCEEHRFASARRVELNQRWVVLESEIRAFAQIRRDPWRPRSSA